MCSYHRYSSLSSRAGLSVLEFVGCLFALLGIDVHHVAYVALSESDLLEKVPEQWRPEVPESAAGAPSSRELAKTVQNELVSLREEISALRSGGDARKC
jgi:hypothetical protein